MKLETLAVHAGYSPDPTTKAVAVPIYQTTSYAFDSTQHGADLFDLKVPGNIYTRIMNPTTDVLEKRVAALEGGIAALAVASGMAAITYAIQTIAEAGDNIVSASTLYGGTYNLFAHTLPQQGITTRFADPRDPASFAQHIDARTKAIFIESIGNPRGNITDREGRVLVGNRARFSAVLHLAELRLEFRRELIQIVRNYRQMDREIRPSGRELESLARRGDEAGDPVRDAG